MSTNWPLVPLGEVLEKAEDWVEIDPTREYKEITVRLWGNGVKLRHSIPGTEIRSARRNRVQAGQFIISRIDARNGACGIVPEDLDGAVVSNDFPVYAVKQKLLLPAFLEWFSKTRDFVSACQHASEGSTNRVRMQEPRFLQTRIPLPPLSEQRRVAERIEAIHSRINKVSILRNQMEQGASALLRVLFSRIIADAPLQPMGDVCPLVRRDVKVTPGEIYHELGVKSFGRGTFHKPGLDYIRVGTKTLYRIKAGDLLFMNVFAWEGAIAVAQECDDDRVGSHRFITCVPKPKVVTADFLCYFFLTPEGLDQIGKASPGGAGRNRTLGLTKLMSLPVPIPAYEKQLWFDQIQQKVNLLLRTVEAQDSASILPKLLSQTFNS